MDDDWGIILLLVLFYLFFGTGCTSSPIKKIDLYRFGDTVNVKGGEYEGGTAIIQNAVDFKLIAPCKVNQYYAYIMRKGFWIRDYVCHEDLDERTIR